MNEKQSVIILYGLCYLAEFGLKIIVLKNNIFPAFKEIVIERTVQTDYTCVGPVLALEE